MRSNSEIMDLIMELAQEKNISLSELARRTNMAKSAVSRYFNKSRQFPLNRIGEFAKALNVTPEFLLDVTPTSEKEIIANIRLEDSNISNMIELYGRLEESRQQKVLSFTKKQLQEQQAEISVASINTIQENSIPYLEDISIVPIRTIERLAAGLGYSYQEDNEVFITYTDRQDLPSYDIASLVTGDSMEPKFHDGDVVLIQNGYDNIQGGIYSIDYDGKSYLKKVYFEGNRFRLVSINKKYKDIFIELPIEDEGVYLNIVGRVVDSFTPVEFNGSICMDNK